jgi:PAS domain S-box-containing protein
MDIPRFAAATLSTIVRVRSALRTAAGSICGAIAASWLDPGAGGTIERGERSAIAAIRKQAELLALAYDAVVVCDVGGRITFWNRGAQETYGWTADEALGRVACELLRTTLPIAGDLIEDVMRREGRWEGELRQITRDGSPIIVASRWSLRRDDRGAPTSVLEINRDITDRKSAEIALQDRERELRQLVDSFPGMVLVANAEGVQQYCNKRTADFLGKAPLDPHWDAETRAFYVYQHAHPDDMLPLANAWRRAHDAGEPLDFHYRLRRHDGVYRWISSRSEPMRDEHGTVVRWYILLVDVDDQRNAEEALRASQAALAHVTRVTTLGEVSASIAHEVRQPLAAIMNNANSCLGLLSAGSENLVEVREALGDIVADAERMNAVIQRIRGLAKRSALERAPLPLKDVVEDVVALANPESAARRVTIRSDVPADLPVVSGDRVQLQQVLLNLVLNGMDAMSSVDGQERVLEIHGRVHPEDAARMVTISVRDRGVGLGSVDIARLFDAFYTTKQHGMGMGLAISRSIIQGHGGRLWAEANQGPGATFSFSLPAGTSA